ncbi:CheY chemotaxis protein or a CheY-like REC (receiver) domain [Mucilaginibacter gossypiicola]|uniref:CheY chemotaxis protein or a CheY-like REC (Receiver) domain n=1 Tax=Mucilaginibacter gossypiicola TaxID=551995 RepID=A0A1H8M8P0_9SPHI|nr:response regulator [Mucilaginibacter gossypiicola]SEO13630.1 CheY chemotaxis protein or a CheY-like REC (receiver) domain [Mucilaginibacter gossypiicola]
MAKTLLYIDDNQIDIAIIKGMQSKYPAFDSVTYSTDAEYSIRYIREHLQNEDELPDVIFLDIYMNPFSGWEFLDEFAKIHHLIGKTIEIYIVSFSILPKDVTRSKQYKHVKSYYTKPVTKETFTSFRVN